MPLKTTKRPSLWLLLLVSLLCVGSVVGIIVGILHPFIQQDNKQATALTTTVQSTETVIDPVMATVIANYDALLSLASDLKVRDPGPPYSPYLVGKLLVVDRQETPPQIDPTFLSDSHGLGSFPLPTNMLAPTPDQVGTVVFIDCKNVGVGVYIGPNTRPIAAYQRSCTLTIIDQGKALVVDKKDFTGSPPPSSLASAVCIPASCSDGVYGDYPAADMVQYLEDLPRK